MLCSNEVKPFTLSAIRSPIYSIYYSISAARTGLAMETKTHSPRLIRRIRLKLASKQNLGV